MTRIKDSRLAEAAADFVVVHPVVAEVVRRVAGVRVVQGLGWVPDEPGQARGVLAVPGDEVRAGKDFTRQYLPGEEQGVRPTRNNRYLPKR